MRLIWNANFWDFSDSYKYSPYYNDYINHYYEDLRTTESNRQIQVDNFFDLTIIERASMAAAALSLIGLTYLSARSQTADLQIQLQDLQRNVENLQYSVASLQSQLSSLSTQVSSSSSSAVNSAVLESTCNTVIIRKYAEGGKSNPWDQQVGGKVKFVLKWP